MIVTISVEFPKSDMQLLTKYYHYSWVSAFGFLRMLSLCSSICHMFIFYMDMIYVCAMDINLGSDRKLESVRVSIYLIEF